MISTTNDTAVVARGLVKRYGTVVALDGLDLQVQRGTVYGLLGPNGAGKTTAIRILTTTLPPDTGRAEVSGYDVRRQASEVRARIGLAGQFAAVDPNLTGRENLRLVGRLAHVPRAVVAARSEDLLGRFGLTDAANRLARTYSGGMRRRLDLAAALVAAPEVIFLDEPTTGLDPESRGELWAQIRELADEGHTVLLTTQHLEEADRLCRRIAIIDRGRTIAEGTPGELKGRVGNTVIELELPDEPRLQQAWSVLQNAAKRTRSRGDGMLAPQRDGLRLRLRAERPTHGLVEILRELDSAGIEPIALALREPSLDEAFLALTGNRTGGDVDGEGIQPNASQRG